MTTSEIYALYVCENKSFCFAFGWGINALRCFSCCFRLQIALWQRCLTSLAISRGPQRTRTTDRMDEKATIVVPGCSTLWLLCISFILYGFLDCILFPGLEKSTLKSNHYNGQLECPLSHTADLSVCCRRPVCLVRRHLTLMFGRCYEFQVVPSNS